MTTDCSPYVCSTTLKSLLYQELEHALLYIVYVLHLHFVYVYDQREGKIKRSTLKSINQKAVFNWPFLRTTYLELICRSESWAPTPTCVILIWKGVQILVFRLAFFMNRYPMAPSFTTYNVIFWIKVYRNPHPKIRKTLASWFVANVAILYRQMPHTILNLASWRQQK